LNPEKIMKVAVLILAVAVVGAFAEDTKSSGPAPFVCTSNAFVCKFKELGHHITYHAKKLGGQLADVGKNVLGAALDQGKNLLASGAQAVLGTVLEHLNKEGIVGKREVALFDKVKEHLKNGAQLMSNIKDKMHAAFKTAVSKITGVWKKTAALEKVDEDADKKIDAAVDEYKKEGKKGFFGLAKTIAGKLQAIFTAGMDKLRAMRAKKVEERAILGFNSLSEAWNKAKSALSGVAGNIADTFRPHLDALKKGISDLGSKAKEHAGNLVNAAKGHFNTIKDKLAGHISTLKGHVANLGGHATSAVNALKEAVANIAMQAVGNVSGTVGDIVNTGKDAAKTVADHVGKTVSDAVSN